MTLCNMSIEGGARVGYVNPDETTLAYLRGRRFAPAGEAFDRAATWWRSIASDPDATYDDEVRIEGGDLRPMVTWGTNPGHSAAVDERVPGLADVAEPERAAVADALAYMGLEAGRYIAGTRVDVAFIGSCNERPAVRPPGGGTRRAGAGGSRRTVRGLVVPGSKRVRDAAEREGLHEVFRDAGFEWRQAGCSMCLAMNPDRLEGRELCASSSNRNFKGRQGSPTGRTLLMSPAMVAAAAVAGEVTDVRRLLRPAEGS